MACEDFSTASLDWFYELSGKLSGECGLAVEAADKEAFLAISGVR